MIIIKKVLAALGDAHRTPKFGPLSQVRQRGNGRKEGRKELRKEGRKEDEEYDDDDDDDDSCHQLLNFRCCGN